MTTKTKLSSKIIDIINNKYYDYTYLPNNKDIGRYTKEDTQIIYIIKSKIRKVKISRILTNNIIEVYRGKKMWFIYLEDKYILYKKDNSLRNILEDIISNKFTINN